VVVAVAAGIMVDHLSVAVLAEVRSVVAISVAVFQEVAAISVAEAPPATGDRNGRNIAT
jgi:hypothetical protein